MEEVGLILRAGGMEDLIMVLNSSRSLSRSLRAIPPKAQCPMSCTDALVAGGSVVPMEPSCHP